MDGRALFASLDRPVLVVVGRGGAGKSTAACGMALALADAGEPTHLISTDPAHSVADIFARPALGRDPVVSTCSPRLRIEEFDAAAYAKEWFDDARGALEQLLERGTYLETELVRELLDLTAPGVEEWMAALRIEEIAGAGGRVVVDTAPAGHALRMLDAGAAIAGWVAALRAIAAKAAAVGSGVLGRPIRLRGEDVLDVLDARAQRYRSLLRRNATFVIVRRAGVDDAAVADRLSDALGSRGLAVGATLAVAAIREEPVAPARPARATPEREAQPTGRRPRTASVAWIDTPSDCDGLRRWTAAVEATPPVGPGAAARGAEPRAKRNARPAPPVDPPIGEGAAWLRALPQRRLLFVGKGGVGKTTCAAAAAVAIAAVRRTRVLGLDPSSALEDVLGVGTAGLPPGLEVARLDADRELAALRGRYREGVENVLARLGVGGSAELDRRVVERLWETAPPGIDELAAVVRLAEDPEDESSVVIDSAATGHFLRLLQLPPLAIGWIRTIVRGIARSGAAASAEGEAHALIRFAGRLRRLAESLRDPTRTAVLLVTLDEPVVAAETDRLREHLRRANVFVAGVIRNRIPVPRRVTASARDTGVAPDSPHDAPSSAPSSLYSLGSPYAPRSRVDDGRAAASGAAVFRAPEMRPAPAGAAALLRFLDAWKLES